jgi:hypothetical protein
LRTSFRHSHFRRHLDDPNWLNDLREALA